MVAKKKISTRKSNSTKRTVKTPKPGLPRMSTVKAKAKKAMKKIARKVSKK